MKIGVFDSGIGGLSVARAIELAFPDEHVVYRYDKEHFPYGGREPAELLGFVVPILQKMVDDGCATIVIACNTVSTTLISELREKFSVPLIAMEPMVKPAAELTKTGTVAVCATPATLASPRYKELKQLYGGEVDFIEPDCSDWAYMVEKHRVDHQKIKERISALCDAGADVIVLACTHYHWIETDIQKAAQNRAMVIQPEPAIVARLGQVLATL